MFRAIRLLPAIALVGVASITHAIDVVPQDLVFYLQHSAAEEGVRVLVGLEPGPQGEVPPATTFTFEATAFGADGEPIGTVGAPAVVGAVTAFDFKVYGSMLYVNGQALGDVQVDVARTAYRVVVQSSRTGRNPRTGETVQIAASNVPGYGSAGIYDLTSGQSRGTVPGFRAGKALKDVLN